MEIKRFKESWRGAFSDRLNLNERKQSKKWKRYLLAEYTKGVESFLNTNSEREFTNLFKVRDIENLYIDLYEEVGVDFAKWYARSFEKFIEKNSGNESTWRTTFSRIGQTEAGDKIILVQGTALKELKRNIGNLFKDPEFQSLGRIQQGRILQSRFKGITEYQAQRIVRTEATSAANEGIMQSAQDIFPKSSLVKEWVSSQDGRTRAFARGDKSDHLNMNGKVVGFDETFAVPELARVVQMKKPADFRSGASAHNIVNCRCSMAVYPKEGAEVSEGVSLTGVGGGVSARTSQLIGDKIVTSRKPATDITSRERAQEFLRSSKEQQIERSKDVIRKSGLDIRDNIVVSPEMTAEKLALYNDEIERLLNKYDISGEKNTPVRGDRIAINFKSDRKRYGVVYRYIKGNKKLDSINFGHLTDPVEIRTSRKKFDGRAKLFGKSQVDEANTPIATVTHEFAHVISKSVVRMADEKEIAFWKELRSIKRKYDKELKTLGEADDHYTFNEVYLGKYASTNTDEFYAEAFTEYELNSNPSKYAKMVGELIEKYFKNDNN